MKYRILLSSLVFLSGCIGVADSFVMVKGFVNDSEGNPLSGVEINFWGQGQLTDKNGCFYFSGVSGPREIELRISANGFKEAQFNAPFDAYEMQVMLGEAGLAETSNIRWTALDADTAWDSPGCDDT